MAHPNDMSTWPAIECQRGHDNHKTRLVRVQVGGPTSYADLTPIPPELAVSFGMYVWDPDAHPVDGLPIYCPAADCVSETIANLGVWAPDETALVLRVLHDQPTARLLDFGAQLGWFSLLGAAAGAHVVAYEADAENLRVLRMSAEFNGWGQQIMRVHERIDTDTEPLTLAGRVRLAKIDVEGSEDEVVRVLWPMISAGRVDHLLIEVTPLFADYYPDLVVSLVGAGYEAFQLPPKQVPPVDLADPATALAPYRLDRLPEVELRAVVAGWSQAMVWFKHADASW